MISENLWLLLHSEDQIIQYWWSMIALKVLELKVHKNRNLVGILNESDYDDKGWHLIIHKIYRIYNLKVNR